jgi:hypothetical protein
MSPKSCEGQMPTPPSFRGRNNLRHRRRPTPPPASPPSSHNNSQHVLAIVDVVVSKSSTTTTKENDSMILEAFSKTSALPCDIWRYNININDNISILLASNYPDCILESDNFCVLSAGFPYHYRDSFCETTETDDLPNKTTTTDLKITPTAQQISFSKTVLDHCEAFVKRETENKHQLSETIGRCLKKVSGHFSLFLVRKTNPNESSSSSNSNNHPQFWAWNDPFGFMPVYHHGSNNSIVLSSHWDCLVPAIVSPSTSTSASTSSTLSSSLELDWDIVAEYLTFGTTLGGGKQQDSSSSSIRRLFDRTLVRGIENLRPGTCLILEAPPSSQAALENKKANNKQDETHLNFLSTSTRSYIACYGACEELLTAKRRKNDTNTISAESCAVPSKPEFSHHSLPLQQTRRFGRSHFSDDNCHHVKGVELVLEKNSNKKNMISPLPSSIDDDTIQNFPNDTENNNNNIIDTVSSLPSASSISLFGEMFAAIFSCIEEALAQGHVGRAALTGGGDTRLILACLLMLQQREQQHQDEQHHLQPTCHDNGNNYHNTRATITFQTHSKQKTDWQIARHLAKLFRLKHKKIRPTSTTMEGSGSSKNLASLLRLFRIRLQEEIVLSNLHDQNPLRRPQRNKRDKHRENVLSYTLHGRFGTEFLGCLCFDKSSLDIRTRQELEDFRPKATRWFKAIFRLDGGNDDVDGHATTRATTIRNPIDTLCDRFEELHEDQKAFEASAVERRTDDDDKSEQPIISFDFAYAFQLQLYTRSCLSDIYKGLRGGSWFSVPAAQFSRNAITPFLDNTLLRLLLCSVSVRDKEEPYELYGKLYLHLHHLHHHNSAAAAATAITNVLLKVPSNNKLLCNHTTIPRAIKAPEVKSRPYFPKFAIHKSRRSHNAGEASAAPHRHNQHQALASLREYFHPVFWKGAIAVFDDAPVKMDATTVGNDTRESVRALVELVGNAQDACLLAGRLQSFLLWYERRFLVHC